MPYLFFGWHFFSLVGRKYSCSCMDFQPGLLVACCFLPSKISRDIICFWAIHSDLSGGHQKKSGLVRESPPKWPNSELRIYYWLKFWCILPQVESLPNDFAQWFANPHGKSQHGRLEKFPPFEDVCRVEGIFQLATPAEKSSASMISAELSWVEVFFFDK